MSDKELIQLIKSNNDERAFSQLYEKYHHMVFLVCLKYLKNNEDSKDMAMNIFIKLHKDIHRFEVTNFKSWLMQITRNACLMHIRDKKMHHVEIHETYITVDEETRDFEKEEAEFSRLEYCISLLNPSQKECVELFFIQKKRYKEIESSTGLDFKQIKSFIQNAKRNLKKCMQGA